MKSKVEKIIVDSILLGATDIHIEPNDDLLKIKVRKDSDLFEFCLIPKDEQPAIISVVKILFNLDIAESRLPQDGRATFEVSNKIYDLRCSTLPTICGEKIALRILAREFSFNGLDDIGFSPESLLAFRKMTRKNSGIILITGPTGSGKTTTLYAALKELDHKEKNIITVEDPVEYKLPGISQVQVNTKSGLTFPKILRSVLRHDPDVILIGEIRDVETASIAMQAALTGHLVFATLHTKDAESAVIRLIELGVEKYLIKDSIIGVVAQRLIKTKTSGRKAIFEIMEGHIPNASMKKLKDSAMQLIYSGEANEKDVRRVIDFE